ncbi:MAG: 6-carboxytetrahydropterin synthase [Acidobacteriota bacterium]|nr:6-carboxytetrahydropterin synthase [Acidobacteriota bacterium]
MRVRLERRYRFCASHLYRREEWSEEENRARFGACANLPGHGHNYRLYVTVAGSVDRATGFMVDLPALDALVQEEVITQLDHQHLNHAVPEFGPGGEIPTSENLILWIHERLSSGLGSLGGGGEVELLRLRLEEDEDLAAEWVAGD